METYPQIAQISTDMVGEENDPQTYALIGAAMEVHRELGSGFAERVYELAMCEELKQRSIPFQAQVELLVHYKSRQLDCHYRADLVCMQEIVVELKAQENLSGADVSQVINYLKASRYRRGLLLNFGAASLQFKRIVF